MCSEEGAREAGARFLGGEGEAVSDREGRRPVYAAEVKGDQQTDQKEREV
jgi:hypothetical protein